MSKVIINQTEFDMYSYFQTKLGVNVRIENSTFGAIETASGDNVTVRIGNEYQGSNLELESMSRIGDTISATFGRTDIEAEISALESTIQSQGSSIASQASTIATHADDIEANAEAITELAEIIGGAE